MYNKIKYEVSNAIAVIAIDRQEALNALDEDVMRELSDAISCVEQHKQILSLIITGEGRSFVAGADITVQKSFDPAAGRAWSRMGSELFRRLEKMEVPTIAAVNGFALGGGLELAMACDIILASEKARFGQPEVTLGIIPGFSGTQRLPRRIGSSMAKELIFSGRIIGADEALTIGLVDHVYAADELMKEARGLAESFAANAPIAVRYAKACIERGMQMDIESAAALENELFALCFATEDQKEGMQAFLDKRDASFKNK